MNTKLATVKKTACRTGLKIQKYSPEILLITGIVGFVGTVALACKQTLKAEEILREHQKNLDDIEDAKKVAEEKPEKYEYDDELMEMDVKRNTLKTAVKLTKAYAPVAAVGALSLTCILTSRNILNRRYLGVVAAYNGLSAAFREYRGRVIKEQGEIMDRHFRYGTELEEIEKVEVDENGKKHKTKEIVEKEESQVHITPDENSRFFDSSNPNWDKDPSFSMNFLKCVQNYCNDILKSRGHIFLNEVYDALGFSHTQAGSIIGWVDGLGDGYIDFGLYDKEKSRGFVNGTENCILLEFNHDGVIWDKI